MYPLKMANTSADKVHPIFLILRFSVIQCARAFKGRITTNPGDWKPVSVLPFLSNIIERVVNHKLVYHFECNNYFFHNQHAFRKGKIVMI